MVEKITNVTFEILSLYRTDYSATLHIRAMAKLIGTSHVALLPYLKRLEELKILSFERSGRNKQYTLNKDNVLTKYYLLIAEELVAIDYLEANFIIKKLAEHLNAADVSSPLILFGSYVKGYATEESDIDLFCIGKLSEKQQSNIERFQTTYGKKVNVKTATAENFDSALKNKSILIREVVANHIVICNPDPFVSILWRQYSEL